MQQPPLPQVAAQAARLAPTEATAAAVTAALAEALGPDRMSTVEAARRAASTDFAHLSPILPTVLPKAPADVVVLPRTVDEVITTVQLAHDHRVPVTPRGTGTGNYGQAVPLARGIVIDLTRCDAVLGVGDGWMRAQAGATFVAMEAAARRTGQEIAMTPTTVGSTIGGFLAGGAGGVGSIEHGWLWDGFVLRLDVVPCPPGASPFTVDAAGCVPYLHAYGVTGIITAASIRLGPARERVAVLASFPGAAGAEAAEAGLALLQLDPPPRLLSLDEPDLVGTFPLDEAMPPGRHSLRAIVDVSTVHSLRAVIAEHSGHVEAVRPAGAAYLTSLAFNHITVRARRARTQLCHLQVSGDALAERGDEVRAALPGAMLHLDGLRTFLDPRDPTAHRHYGGLLLSPFHDAQTLYAGATHLTELGIHVVDPHTWLLGGPALPDIRAAATTNDPAGLLNPGKLPPALQTVSHLGITRGSLPR